MPLFDPLGKAKRPFLGGLDVGTELAKSLHKCSLILAQVGLLAEVPQQPPGYGAGGGWFLAVWTRLPPRGFTPGFHMALNKIKAARKTLRLHFFLEQSHVLKTLLPPFLEVGSKRSPLTFSRWRLGLFPKVASGQPLAHGIA